VFGVVAALHAASRALTYRLWADGAAEPYATSGLFAMLLGGIAWLAIRVTVPAPSLAQRLLPWATLVAVAIPADVYHYLRLSYPVARTGELEIERRVSGADDLEREWIVERGAGGSVAVTADGTAIASPPGGVAYLDFRLPDPLDPFAPQMWLPRVLLSERYGERVEWESRVALENAYFVLVQTRHVLVQVATFGLHVTYPAADGRITEHHVERPEMGRGGAHRFVLERRDGVTRLSVDGGTGWTAPDAGKLGLIRFGESRPDALHGGRMTLGPVRYTRLYASA
jgi:hypothetical protein